MKPFSIALCDDDPKMLSYLTDRIQQSFSKYNTTCHVHAYSSSSQLYTLLDTQEFDIIFLDIDMPEVSGFDLAQKTVRVHPQMLIIFVTSHDELVFPTFQYSPFRFLRKSYFEQEIDEAVESAVKSISERNRMLEIQTPDGVQYVYLSEILYFESEKNYLNIITRRGLIRCRETLSKQEKALSGTGFIRVHSGYLVNQKYIYSIDNECVRLRSRSYPEVPLSRRRRDQVIQEFQKYIRS